MRYRDSGVDIDKANEATRAIARLVKKTWGGEVLSEIGSFGGLFRVPAGMREPVLVSSMDGVGTKLLVARAARRYNTVGQDLVNHCVNDILVQGARPLFFLDYVAAGKVEPDVIASLVSGLAQACAENGCALIGGETAEMPGLYQEGDFDLAGTIVGVVERAAIIDGSSIVPGDVVFALPSNGLHTNGYSLARRIAFETLGLAIDARVDELGATVADEFLRVHRSYLAAVNEIAAVVTIKGLAHITGGGVLENLPRILPDGCGARVERGAWPVPPVFRWIARNGDVVEGEMYRVFNMGLGMLVVVSPEDASRIPSRADGLEVYRAGVIVRGDGSVSVE
ncbi:MAG TPA: phosphoribosylformylglycinamidine cyclo-ligase [Candidatus Krumholzibacteria bacterium]|nr:phosphoribosylformylglycinamidine cyclo-ligase [Candidatus Krumholzibacteria bacterium]